MKEETKCYCGHTTYCDCGPEEPFRHKGQAIPAEEILANRSNAYEFINIDKMKNVHVLPTDKPSRLFISDTDKILELDEECIISEDWWIKNQNIYITNDEKIKVNDYVLDDEQDVFQVLEINHITGILRSDGFTYVIDVCKKIILTTDQELIKDGVQTIDDEFLEWFVKNPSCEEVEIKKWTDYKLENDKEIPFFSYKIIIPKEESKQETLEKEPNFYEKLVEYFKNTPREKVLEDWNKTAECDNIGPTMEEFLGNKQETIEEAAERIYPINIVSSDGWDGNFLCRIGFYIGYELAQERSYSESEVLEIIYKFKQTCPYYIEKWFEQFKKK